MMKLALTGLVLAFGTVGAAGAADKDDPTGTWKWTGMIGKREVDQILKLELKDGKVTGTLVGGKFDLKIEDGKFKDGELSFTATGELKGEKVVAKYAGKVTGDTIKGSGTTELKGRQKTDTWEAKRDTPEKKKD